MTIEQLAQIIKDNPGCIARIDNDSWTLERQPRSANPHLAEEAKGYSEAADDWDTKNILARAYDCEGADERTFPFGSCCYGGHILDALALVVGIQVEGA